MFRGLIFLALLVLAATTFSDGPGSRIGLGPVPQPAGPVAGPMSGPADRDAQRCEQMRRDAKDRCLRELQMAVREAQRAPHAGPNPESAGVGATAPDIGPRTTGPGSVGGSK